MGIIGIILLGIALSIDSFAFSIALGLCGSTIVRSRKIMFLTTVSLMHAIMIFAGWYCGGAAHRIIADYDHWVAAAILSVIGVKMIMDSIKGDEEQHNSSLSLKQIAIISFTLSIDAFASGFSFALVPIKVCSNETLSVLVAAIIVSLSVLIISATGLYAGKAIERVFGTKVTSKSGILAGVVLIVIGVKMVLEHI